MLVSTIRSKIKFKVNLTLLIYQCLLVCLLL